MQVKEASYYRTKGGPGYPQKIVGPMVPRVSSTGTEYFTDGSGRSWLPSGSFFSERESHMDLVEEVKEEEVK